MGFRMKKIVCIAMVSAAALALSACGSSDSANEEATAENVEMPAEEAMTGVEATPVADPAATAPAETASDAASAAPSAEASAAAEDATKEAEKTM